MKTPTDSELNLAICEWMGWKNMRMQIVPYKHQYDKQLVGDGPNNTVSPTLAPNYLSDDSPRRLLDEAEAKLTEQQFEDYYSAIEDMTPIGRPQHKRRALLSSTARQRVIAILKTIKPELFQ